MNFPNIYGRKPSAVVNGSQIVATFDSRREARRHRAALAKERGLHTGALRIVANGPQEPGREIRLPP